MLVISHMIGTKHIVVASIDIATYKDKPMLSSRLLIETEVAHLMAQGGTYTIDLHIVDDNSRRTNMKFKVVSISNIKLNNWSFTMHG